MIAKNSELDHLLSKPKNKRKVLIQKKPNFGIFGTFALVLHNLANGIWSKFPLCCVLNYIYLDVFKRVAASMYMQVKYPELFKEVDNADYVRCKKCLKNKHVVPPEKQREGGVVIIPLSWLHDQDTTWGEYFILKDVDEI